MPLAGRLGRWRRGAALVAAIGLAGCAVGFVVARREFFEGYLVAWWFCLGLSLGAMANLMVHELTGGTWGEVIRSPLEAAVRALPVLALLIVPLLFALPDLYPWAQPQAVLHDRLLQQKSWYLNRPGFFVRTAVELIVWFAVAALLAHGWKRRQHDDSPRVAAYLKRWSVIGLIVYAITITTAGIDWLMSLTPQWYSSTFGLLLATGQGLAGFTFGIAAAGAFPGLRRPTGRSTADDFQDLGNLLLMFVMMWAYLAFTQYLIIWAEDLPHESSWYLPRVQTGWRAWAIALIVLHFAVPFFVLLFRGAKRRVASMIALATALLAIHWADTLWLVVPTFRPHDVGPRWIDFAAILFVGGTWLATVITCAMREAAALPRRSISARASQPEERQHG